MREAPHVGALRWVFRNWPVPGGRGRGVLLRAARPLLQEGTIVALEPGVLVRLNPTDYMSMHHFLNGFSEDPAFELGRRLASEGCAVLDVGAHEGYWVMGVARRGGADSVVHAAEPLPTNYERLVRNVEGNGLPWVRTHDLAFGDRVGEAAFQRPPEEHTGRGRLTGDLSGSAVRVRMTTLDEFCRAHVPGGLDLVKVDVEGAEVKVFEGGKALLQGPDAPVVIFEVGDYLAAESGVGREDSKRFLVESGFSIFRYRAGRLEAVDVEATHPGSEDLVGLKVEHGARYGWLREIGGPW